MLPNTASICVPAVVDVAWLPISAGLAGWLAAWVSSLAKRRFRNVRACSFEDDAIHQRRNTRACIFVVTLLQEGPRSHLEVHFKDSGFLWRSRSASI